MWKPTEGFEPSTPALRGMEPVSKPAGARNPNAERCMGLGVGGRGGRDRHSPAHIRPTRSTPRRAQSRQDSRPCGVVTALNTTPRAGRLEGKLGGAGTAKAGGSGRTSTVRPITGP